MAYLLTTTTVIIAPTKGYRRSNEAQYASLLTMVHRGATSKTVAGEFGVSKVPISQGR